MTAMLFLPAFVAGANGASRFGTTVTDPAGIIDLPPGFTYKVVARTGDTMNDGLRVPALPDGMGAFNGADGTVIVVCNHECRYSKDGAFGADGSGLARVDTTKIYDRSGGVAPLSGSTTTFVWDTRTQSLVRHQLSLAGTTLNCSGGSTPWGTWLSCEETSFRAGWCGAISLELRRDHGFVFEVPAAAPGLVDPIPLAGMGRFTHESIAHDGKSGVFYETEDLLDGLFYRFLPAERGNLRAGGTLQALAFQNGWRESNNRVPGAPRIRVGDSFPVHWIGLDAVDAPGNDLRRRGFDLGACRFDRGEGICVMEGAVYFTCTTAGAAEAGQVWRYLPSKWEGESRESRSPGRVELIYEVTDPSVLVNPDNLTPAPGGGLLVCEDPENAPWSRLVLIGGEGVPETFAHSRKPGELTGAVFSPDGSTLFVNMQKAGITLAITGPWRKP